MRRIASAWAVVFLWIALVAWISLVPSPPGTRLLVRLSGMFPAHKLALRAMQALVHLAVYGGGALLIAAAIAPTRRSLPPAGIVVCSMAIVMVVGLILEVLQEGVPQRQFDLLDLSGDFAGAVVAFAFAWIIRRGPFRRPVVNISSRAANH